LFVIVFI